MNNSLFTYLLLIYCFVSCTKNIEQKRIEKVLSIAGENRQELQKVLDYYQTPKDSLKLKAAKYLIMNMPGHYGKDNELLQKFESYVAMLRSKLDDLPNLKDGVAVWRIRNKKFTNEMDHFEEEYGKLSSSNLSVFPDIENISSSFLIENIEYAFKAWKMPWSKKLNFEEFCTYVLPYRIGTERLESWRPYFYNEFKNIGDSLKDPTDPIEVCIQINGLLNRKGLFQYSTRLSPFINSFSAEFIYQTNMAGACVDMSNMAVQAMRSVGLPVCKILIPKYGDIGTGHTCNAVLDTIGVLVDFMGAGQAPLQHTMLPRKATKVLRVNFEFDWEANEAKKLARQELTLLHKKDVTEKLIPTSNVKILIPEKYKNEKIAYLCSFDNQRWKAIDWIEINEGVAHFKHIGRDVVYLPVIMDEHWNDQISIAPPFLLDSLGKKTFFKPLKETRFFEFDRKYPPNQGHISASKSFIGAQFEVANNPEFKKPTLLYQVGSTPKQYPEKIDVKNIKSRYVRFKYPSLKKWHYYGLAQVSFYQKEKRLKGKYLYSEGVEKEHLKKIFGNDILSYTNVFQYEAELENYYWDDVIISKSKNNELWIGLDLETETLITDVGFCPQNDKNGIYKGMSYELFYWNKGWISLGEKESNGATIKYDNIPKGALLLLKNHTEGKEERIFTIEKGKQVWW